MDMGESEQNSGHLREVYFPDWYKKQESSCCIIFLLLFCHETTINYLKISLFPNLEQFQDLQ